MTNLFNGKKIQTPPLTPPLEGRGKAAGRRPQVGRSSSAGLLPKGRENEAANSFSALFFIEGLFDLVKHSHARIIIKRKKSKLLELLWHQTD